MRLIAPSARVLISRLFSIPAVGVVIACLTRLFFILSMDVERPFRGLCQEPLMMSVRSVLSAAVALGLVSTASAWADPANHLVANYGDITLPFTRGISNSFSGTQALGFNSQDGQPVVYAAVGDSSYFYDDYVFTLPQTPQASFDAAAVSISLGSCLSLDNFSARVYRLEAGLASLTTGLPGSEQPIQAWTSTTVFAPGTTGTTVLFQNVALLTGATYALEFRGTIGGGFGGSYGGSLSITPVPEPGGLALVASSLGVMAGVARRRRWD